METNHFDSTAGMDFTLVLVASWYIFYVVRVCSYEYLRVRTTLSRGKQGKSILDSTCRFLHGIAPKSVCNDVVKQKATGKDGFEHELYRL